MYNKFEKFGLDGYPPEIRGRFNSFITTQFDDSLSVEMQIRSIIKWAINNFDETVNQTNHFIDFINDLIEYMNEFIETFDTKFQDEILLNLQKWNDDGTLETLINESLDTKYHEMVNRLAQQLEQKASKEEVSYKRDTRTDIDVSDISPSLLGLIETSDGTPVSILSEPRRESVSYDKTTFLKVGKNLFDKTKVTAGKFVRHLDGELGDNSNITASDFIPIGGGKKYHIRRMSFTAFYDEHREFISGINEDTNDFYTFTAPSNAHYLRTSTRMQYLDEQQIEEGNVFTQLEEYVEYLSNQLKVTNQNLTLNSVDESNLNFTPAKLITSKNLFDKSNVTGGKFVRYQDGALGDNSNVTTSDFIPIVGGVSYTIKRVSFYAFYGENREYISGGNFDTATEHTFTAPANALFIRMSTRNQWLDEQQLERGESSTSYEEYYKYLDLDSYHQLREDVTDFNSLISSLQLQVDGIVAGTGENKLFGKRVAWNGDSICANPNSWATVIGERNEMDSTNYAISGGTIVYTLRDTGVVRHCISQSIDSMRTDVDYVMMSGGYNDSQPSIANPIGEMTAGFNDVYDTDTFIGALEWSCRKLIGERYLGKKIGWILTPRNYETWDEYREVMIPVLEKWGVPYIDLSKVSRLVSQIDSINEAYFTNADRLHPNSSGHRILADLIESWMKTL